MTTRTNPQLLGARARLATTLPDTCTIKGWLKVTNSRGNSINRAEYERATGVPCWLTRDVHPVFMSESGGAYGRAGALIDTNALAWTLYLAVGTTIASADHVVMADGARYEVTSVDDSGSYRASVVCGLIRLGLDQPGAGTGG